MKKNNYEVNKYQNNSIKSTFIFIWKQIKTATKTIEYTYEFGKFVPTPWFRPVPVIRAGKWSAI